MVERKLAQVDKQLQAQNIEMRQALVEPADEAVHIVEPEEGEQVSDADVAFHQALCLVGISTEALDELGGCEALPPIGGDD